jgi:hypothetical protein
MINSRYAPPFRFVCVRLIVANPFKHPFQVVANSKCVVFHIPRSFDPLVATLPLLDQSASQSKIANIYQIPLVTFPPSHSHNFIRMDPTTQLKKHNYGRVALGMFWEGRPIWIVSRSSAYFSYVFAAFEPLFRLESTGIASASATNI